jgi:hypothetical protein
MKTEERHLSIYDGRDCIGALIARPGVVHAFDAKGVHLGTFKTFKAASSAINTTANKSCIADLSARMDGS